MNRHSFWEAGQDSWTLPPTQNQDMFTLLSNVEPVLQGILQRRRGYTLFTNNFGGNFFTRAYSFRSEALSLRELVFSSPTNVVGLDESGATILSPIFTPSTGATAPRMALSRDFGYFADGVAQDYLKWNGTAQPNSVSNWGIDVNGVLGVSTFGPNNPSTATDINLGGLTQSSGPLGPTSSVGTTGWSSANNIFVADSISATQVVTRNGGLSGQLVATGFGFNIPAGATIKGVQASVLAGSIRNLCTDFSVKLVKGGVVSGTNQATGDSIGFSLTYLFYGSNSNLWGLALTPADVNASNFGFMFQAENQDFNDPPAHISQNDTVSVDFMALKVFYTMPTALWTNVSNVQALDGLVATNAVTAPSPTDSIQVTGYGLGFPSAGLVGGITVNVVCGVSTLGSTLSVQLLKAGVPTGKIKTAVVSNTTLAPITFGSSSDLWGVNWLPADINSTTFGVQIFATPTSGSPILSVDAIQVTVNANQTALVVGAPFAGNITLLSGRVYFYAFQNSKTGHTSDLSAPSLSTGPLTSQNVPLSNIPTSGDPQVDTVILLSTADGGDETFLFFLASLPNGTTSYIDNTPNATLLTANIYQETDEFGFLHGIANNKRPPTGTFPIKHKGRIYMASGHILFFSKNLDDVVTSTGLTSGKWEEAWPAINQIDISTRAETISGLLSDGETLWIGTERAIRRLVGDSPQNFQEPEIQFNETGVLKQEVWQVVFFEGQPVGTCWMTPDLRVMASDFNSYHDIGTPIQDVLNGVNPAALQTIHACFVSQGPADYYMLYLPTGNAIQPNVVCVYNLRAHKWCVWAPSDPITSSLFNINGNGQPQWLFTEADGDVDFWDNTVFLDRNNNPNETATPYAVTIQTSWLDMGDYNIRKFVNQIIPTTADQSNLTVQVDGASNELDFNGPLSVVSATVVTPASIPTDVFVPLASGPSHNRAFRFTFVSPPSQIQNVLTGFAIEAGQFHRY